MSKEKSIPAAKLKLLDAAPDFDLPVTINVRGTEDKVTITCKTFGKLEWAAVRDENADEAKARSDERSKAIEGGARLRMTEIVREGMAADSAIVMKFAVDWDFSEPLNAESLAKLENMAGGSLAAIVGAYEAAIYQGRLGN